MAIYVVLVCILLVATLFCINSRSFRVVAALKYAGILVLQSIPISLVLFVLFPRVDPPHWMLFDDHHAKSGLSDVMEPGSISNLALSDELVFRVRFSGALPSADQRYWRGPTLYHTDGKRWTQKNNSALRQPSERPKFSGPMYQYTLLMEPQHKNWVFALDMAADYSSSLQLQANFLLVTSGDPGKRAEHKITSFPSYNTGDIASWERQQALQLPAEASEKIKNFISTLQGFDSAPEIFIKRLLNHFRQENFHYTLTPPLLDENPIETFLFETKQGFCSHYASAFVYLMRAANIPARVVIGFQGGEVNELGGFLEVRQSDAHAWAEVWLKNQGWKRIDPTAAIAPERIEQTINTEQLVPGELIRYIAGSAESHATFDWLKQSRQLWGHIDYKWQRWVINYDNKNQSRFLSVFGINGIKTMIYWMVFISSIVIALLAWMLLYQKGKKEDPVLIIYNKFCKKIAKLGLIIDTGEGAIAFAHRINCKFPLYIQQVDEITAAFVKVRYRKISTPEDVKRFQKLVSKLKL